MFKKLTLEGAIASLTKNVELLGKVAEQHTRRVDMITVDIVQLQDERDGLNDEIAQAKRIKEKLQDLLK